MYSLYRAWLSLGPPPPPPTPPPAVATASTSTLNLGLPMGQTAIPGAPDVSLQVGPGLTHFSAHKSVLSAHSGFFKAALAAHGGLTPITVPNVNVDEFSCLLTFMYTGYLDLNLTNIYNILLATHILHMPRALEICRTFLIQQQHHQQQATPTPPPPLPQIIKPIASRKTAHPHPQIHPPTHSNLQKSESTPFKTISRRSQREEEAGGSGQKEEEPTEGVKRAKAAKKRQPHDVVKEKTVVDIACCDGPVRFHRVINKNYGLPTMDGDYKLEVNRTQALNRAMNENIRDKQLSDENQAGNDVFTCLYCNHTFKSQYCYQKHARRHLNPVNIDAKNLPADGAKREVKLLDMNVQYYPCKTCGCKFPSYYFVHKHRKLCHAEEMEGGVGEGLKSVEEEKGVGAEQSDDSSAIDVEAVNQ